MKAKTIKKVLREKVDEWLASIEDVAVREIAAKNTIITGGAIASMLLAEMVNDFDIYFRNHATAKALAEYYVGRFKPKKANGIPCNISLFDQDGRIKVVIKSSGIAGEDGTEKPYEYFESRPDDEASVYVDAILKGTGNIEDAREDVEHVVLNAEDDGKPKYRPVFMSTNAITLSNRIQIVLRFYGDPDQIHENYDFVHCTNYWTSWDNELVLRQPALEALLARELRYVGSKYPVCSVIRLRKFIARGWSINAGQILKMMMQISDLDLNDVSILEDQLTGVDAAYFVQILNSIKEKDPQKIDTAYLVEIIDRIF